MRAVRAIRVARLDRWTGLCFAEVFRVGAGFFFAMELDDAALSLDGAVVDCPASGHATKSNSKGIPLARSAERKERIRGVDPSIIPLYSDFDANGAIGEPTL